MGRPKTDIRISLKGRDGTTVRVGLTKMIDGRFAVYRNGKRSEKVSAASATRIGQLIANWILTQ